MEQIRDVDNQKTSTISSKELHEWLREIPANKQVMILDTCSAGAVAEELVSKRDLTADQIRAELAALGVTIEDHGDGSAWRRTS